VRIKEIQQVQKHYKNGRTERSETICWQVAQTVMKKINDDIQKRNFSLSYEMFSA
jgi:hypothetical protein